MKFPIKDITIIFLLFISFYATAQRVSVSAEVDSTMMVIGDKFKLHLVATYPQNAALESIDLTALKEIENVDIEAETDWDSTVVGRQILLNIYKTNRIPITVAAVILQDSVQLADIKDILREKANWEDYLFLIVAFGLICLAVLGYYLWKRKEDLKTAPPPPEIIIPAHEIALTALTQLKGEKLWQQGDIKTYQSRLTYIIREYLENRYEVPALESTTDEILRSLKNVDFDSSWKDKLQNILQVADLVKFAKAKPPADFHDKVLQEAEDFVIATKVKPIVVEDTTTTISNNQSTNNQ